MALHLAFDLPKDKIVWDVGHQAYTHKPFKRKKGRIRRSAPVRRDERVPEAKKRARTMRSTRDTAPLRFPGGLGIAQAREITGEEYSVISVIGDGALTGGMAYEALNNAAQIKKNFIIVLNDNEMSISKNVGGMSRYLEQCPHEGRLCGAETQVWNGDFLDPGDRKADGIWALPVKERDQAVSRPGMLFEDMGITYLGPVERT